MSNAGWPAIRKLRLHWLDRKFRIAGHPTIAVCRSVAFLMSLNNRSPAQVIDLEKSAQAQHESRYGQDQLLSDWHCDQYKNAEIAIGIVTDCGGSIAFSVHKTRKVIGPLSIRGVEGKIYLSRCHKHIAQFVVLPKKISVGYGGLVQQIEHRH